MTEQKTADALAEAAVAEINSGMVVGLGSGRTATRCIRSLGDRVRDEKLEIQCVPTSVASEELAKELGLEIIDFALVEQIDYLFDGADEVDAQLRMLKGAGGAMTRERMVAWASDRSVYVVDESKVVERLGTRKALSVAVMAFGLASIRAAMRDSGLNGVCRRTLDGHLYVTDNGNLILDVTLEDHDIEELGAMLNSIPGVVDHGLFLNEADEILVESNGKIERLIRS